MDILKINQMNILACGATDIGKRRGNNEDCYRLLPEKNIYMVADGMGGHKAGEVASLKAVETASEYFTEERIKEMKKKREKVKKEMIQAIMEAHQAIMTMSEAHRDYAGMGSTIVLSFIHNKLLYVCHVGDSRIYVINQSEIIQITNDHSVAAELLRMGKLTKKEVRHSLLRNQLTQALGYSYYLSPEYHEYILSKGDNVLLCSDGLWDMLSDDEIYSIVMEGGTVKEVCKNLVDRANEAGGDDNITVLLIKCTFA